MNLPQTKMVSDTTLDAALQRAKEEAGATHYYQGSRDVVRLFRPRGEGWEMGILYRQSERRWTRVDAWISWEWELAEAKVIP